MSVLNEAIDLPITVPSAGSNDEAFTIEDDVDSTKQLAFEVSAVSSDTTRRWRVPDSDGILPANPLSITNICLGAETYVFANDSDDDGEYNSYVGYECGIATTTGYYNSAFGANCLQYNDTGRRNCAFGQSALQYNTSGYDNCVFGRHAMRGDSEVTNTGNSNSAFGAYALRLNSVGYYNTAVGHGSLSENGSGSYNTAIGTNSLQYNIDGEHNTALGYNSGTVITTGDYNTLLGQDTNTDVFNRNGCLVLGKGAISRALDNTLTIGNEEMRTAIVSNIGAETITHVISVKIGDQIYKLMASDA